MVEWFFDVSGNMCDFSDFKVWYLVMVKEVSGIVCDLVVVIVGK